MTGDQDFAMGTVSIELDIMLTSTSGREKHTDVEEQGAWLIDPIAKLIEENYQFDDATVLRVRYMGAKTPGENPLRTVELSGRPKSD